jgi:hypothetical protein
MKTHYFLKGLALSFSNYVGYTEYDNALFFIKEKELNTLTELKENIIHFDTYFYNQDLKISFYKEDKNNFILVEEINSEFLSFENTYKADIEEVLQEIGTNIFI